MTLLAAQGTEYGLIAQFREFHSELLRIRYALGVGGRLAERGEGTLDAGELAGRVHHRLRSLLERQATDALRRSGGYGAELYREAQYLMAALADEVLLHRLDWDGRDLWTDHLLENALFGTQVAGERVFDRLESILAEGGRIQPELASIYLATLSLGFRGRLWRPADARELRGYRQGLARAIARHDPDMTRREKGHLFPGAYAATLSEGRAVRLPHVRPWLVALAGLVVAFLVVSHTVWQMRTSEIDRVSAYVATESLG
jgi:type VI secretion system protein ImpK